MRMNTEFSVDLFILLLFLLGFEPALTGDAVHEWLNLGFAAVMLVHLVMHWGWITVALPRALGKTPRRLRVNVLLNSLSFLVFVMMILSGLLISENVSTLFGIATARHSVWNGFHSMFGDVLLVLIGFHFAMHWKWIIHTIRSMPASVRSRFAGSTSGERSIS